MSSKKEVEVYRYVDGVYLSHEYHVFSDESTPTMLSYKAQPGDVVVTGYPKSGTKWMKLIIFGILNDGVLPKEVSEFMPKSPFTIKARPKEHCDVPRAGATKTHLPLRQAVFCDEAKYIFTCRNPYDICVSYYYHHAGLPGYRFENGTFDQFLDMFLSGKVDFRDYFDQRNKPNVLLVTYEDLKKDPRACMLKVAEFLGEEYSTRLRETPKLLDRTLMAISDDNMKEFNDGYASSGGRDVMDRLREKARLMSLKPRKAGTLFEKALSGIGWASSRLTKSEK